MESDRIMLSFETPRVRLRALEPGDVEILYRWENDARIWGVSDTLLPFSRHTLTRFIADQARSIYETRQTRFIIESSTDSCPVGAIDLFDFDPHHLRAGVGILIYDETDRKKGYASDALRLLITYGFEVLRLHQLYCNVSSDNTASLALFEKCGFVRCGLKRDWLHMPSGWQDEYMLQIINESKE